jgi:hypothetical protein
VSDNWFVGCCACLCRLAVLPCLRSHEGSCEQQVSIEPVLRSYNWAHAAMLSCVFRNASVQKCHASRTAVCCTNQLFLLHRICAQGTARLWSSRLTCVRTLLSALPTR